MTQVLLSRSCAEADAWLAGWLAGALSMQSKGVWWHGPCLSRDWATQE